MVLVYVDANVFITAFEAEGLVAAPARALFVAGRAKPHSLVTSELTIAEVLAPASAPDSLPLARKLEIYQTILLWSGFVMVVPVTREILLGTVPLRAAHRQKLPDAIHASTALHASCSHFCSADRYLQRLPAGLKPVVPDQTGLSVVLDMLRS